MPAAYTPRRAAPPPTGGGGGFKFAAVLARGPPPREAGGRADHLDDVRIGALLVADDLGTDRSDVDLGLGKRRQRGADRRRLDGRDVALEVDDDLLGRAEPFQRLVDAGAAVEVIGAGHHRLAAGQLDRRSDGEIVGGDDDAADRRLDGAAPDMDDHRGAVDVGERLARQPDRGHAGGDEDDRLGAGVFHGFRTVAKSLNDTRLYGLPPGAESL